MTLTITYGADPLSPASLDGTLQPQLIRSDASRLVTSELRRYCRREITGRSILVAGHRGGGKTTLVLEAFLDLLKEAGQRGHLRPLLVMLHGPSLLPPRDDAAKQPPEAVPPSDPQNGKVSGDNAPEATQGSGPPSQDAQGTADQSAQAAASESRAVEPRKTETQIALEQITVGLYRALARELSAAFRVRALEHDEDALTLHESPSPPEGTERPGDWHRFQVWLLSQKGRSPSPGRVSEVAAQLELDLYQSLDPTRLRLFWREADALRWGLLKHGLPRADDQGWRELVALASANAAYLRCSGTVKASDEQTGTETRKTESELRWEAAGENLVRPILTLLAGGVVGAGALSTTHSTLQSGLAALVGALGAAGVLKLSAKSSRERKRTVTLSFVPDTSVSTLDRVLPILVDRLNACGLAPVFVVDELDKVPDLSGRMTRLVHDLKKFVAENAFFCWLTDRIYYEEVEAGTRTHAYARVSTYFTYRLFLGFWPDDLRDYLWRLMPLPPEVDRPPELDQRTSGGIPTPSPIATPAAPGASRSRSVVRGLLEWVRNYLWRSRQVRQSMDGPPGLDQPVSGGTPPPGGPRSPPKASDLLMRYQKAVDEREEDLIDRELWPWVLIHRAQLHPIDLHREIAALRRDDGSLVVPSGRVRVPRYFSDMLAQLAIEIVLDQEEVRPWFAREAGKRRFAYDALYYLSRKWWEGKMEVDLEPSGSAAFEEYLAVRLGTEDWERRKARERKGGGNGSQDDPVSQLSPTELLERALTPDDRAFLFARVRRVAELLSDAAEFRSRLTEWRQRRTEEGQPVPSDRFIAALPIGQSKPDLPMERQTTPDGTRFRWRYDPGGIVREAPPEAAARGPTPAPPEWEEQAAQIRSVAAMLARISA